MILLLFTILVLMIVAVLLCCILFGSPAKERFDGSGFVEWKPQKNEFQIEGKTFYAVGCNMPWMGLIVANDSYNCFIQPADKDVVDTLTYARNILNCNVIRCHTLGFSAFSDNSFLLPNGKINEKYWKTVDLIIRTSKKLGLYLIPVLTDQYNGYNGNYNIFLGPGETSVDFFKTDSKAFQNYKSFLSAFLYHKVDGIEIKEEPTIFCLEFGNELGDHFGMSADNCVRDQTIICAWNPSQRSLQIPGTSCHVPTKEWLVATKNHLRDIDQNHMLMTGANWCQLNPPIQTVGQCEWDLDGIDIVSFHWYFKVQDDMTDFYYDQYDQNRFEVMRNACQTIRDKNKAVIFGEYPATYGHIKDFFNQLDGMIRDDLLQGELFWDLVYDGYIQFGADVEGDGSSAPQGFAVAPVRDSALLKMYANHFKKYRSDDSSPDTCLSWDACQQQCVQPEKDFINILLIGDSITAGYHCRGPESWQCGNCGTCQSLTSCDLSTQCKTITDIPPGAGNCGYTNNCSSSFGDFLGDYLKKNAKLDIRIYNNAIKGTTAIKNAPNYCPFAYGGPYVTSAFGCWDQSLNLKEDIDFITIMFGTNDGATANDSCFTNDADRVNETVQQLQNMVTQLKQKYPRAVIFVMRPPPSQSPNLNLDVINNRYEQFKTIQDCVYIDLYNEIKNFIGNNPYEKYFCDTIHPFTNLNLKIGEIIGNEMMNYIKAGNLPNPTVTFSRCNTGCADDQ